MVSRDQTTADIRAAFLQEKISELPFEEQYKIIPWMLHIAYRGTTYQHIEEAYRSQALHSRYAQAKGEPIDGGNITSALMTLGMKNISEEAQLLATNIFFEIKL